jgi:hypothetical protein
LLPNLDTDIENDSNINNFNAVPNKSSGQPSNKVATIINTDLETITDEYSRAINTIILHGAQIGPFSPHKVPLKNEASNSISPSPNRPPIPLNNKLGSINCARTLFNCTTCKVSFVNENNRNLSQNCTLKDNLNDKHFFQVKDSSSFDSDHEHKEESPPSTPQHPKRCPRVE